jgi:hypothetical protein
VHPCLRHRRADAPGAARGHTCRPENRVMLRWTSSTSWATYPHPDTRHLPTSTCTLWGGRPLWTSASPDIPAALSRGSGSPAASEEEPPDRLGTYGWILDGESRKGPQSAFHVDPGPKTHRSPQTSAPSSTERVTGCLARAGDQVPGQGGGMQQPGRQVEPWTLWCPGRGLFLPFYRQGWPHRTMKSAPR